MTPAQIKMYWREWSRVRKHDPCADRHALHISALGFDKSSRKLTNAELDLVLAEFWRISRPDDLNAQIRQQNMTKTRALHTCRSFPPLYVQSICLDRFGTRNFETLPIDKLHQLAMTLNKRHEAAQQRHSNDPEATEPSQSIHLSTADCPF